MEHEEIGYERIHTSLWKEVIERALNGVGPTMGHARTAIDNVIEDSLNDLRQAIEELGYGHLSFINLPDR